MNLLKEEQTCSKNMFRVKKIQDDYYKLDRAGQVILIRLCTGNNRPNAHVNKKMKLVPTSMCICNIIENQTTKHILQRSMATQHHSATETVWNSRGTEEKC